MGSLRSGASGKIQGMGRPPIRAKTTNAPSIVVDLEWREGVFYLVLENHAQTLMRDISVGFRRKIMGQGGQVNISALPIWTKLHFMPPRKRIEVVVDRDAVFFAINRPGPVGVTVTYSDPDGVRWRGQLLIDFDAYRGFPDLRLR